MASLTRSIRAEFLEQLLEAGFGNIPVNHGGLTVHNPRKRKEDEQRLVNSAPVTALPDTHAVECPNDLFARHDQYRAWSGSTQRTPPRGSSLSPA